MSGKRRTSTVMLLLLGMATAAQAQRGTINGKVRYAGPIPSTQLEMTDDARQFCGSVSALQHEVRRGAVSNVVVYLEDMPSVDLAGKPVGVRNVNCDFQPAVQIAETGATLLLSNNDAVGHVVRMYRSLRLVGEYALPRAGGSLIDQQLLKVPGLIDVQCRYHKGMHSSIWVFDHPYYALTAEDGTFQLPFVAPGRYRITAWHSEMGFQTLEVTVTADQAVPVEFVFQHAVTQ